jgi:adenylate cyclase
VRSIKRLLLATRNEKMIDITRFIVKRDTYIFDVDAFYVKNEGVILYKIVLRSETETYEKPARLGIEVIYNKNIIILY